MLAHPTAMHFKHVFRTNIFPKNVRNLSIFNYHAASNVLEDHLRHFKRDNRVV